MVDFVERFVFEYITDKKTFNQALGSNSKLKNNVSWKNPTPWNPSTKALCAISPEKDCLRDLLERGLIAKGFKSDYDTAAALFDSAREAEAEGVRIRIESELAQKEIKALKKIIKGELKILEENELTKRRAIHKKNIYQRKELQTVMFSEQLDLVQLWEFDMRRSLLREALIYLNDLRTLETKIRNGPNEMKYIYWKHVSRTETSEHAETQFGAISQHPTPCDRMSNNNRDNPSNENDFEKIKLDASNVKSDTKKYDCDEACQSLLESDNKLMIHESPQKENESLQTVLSPFTPSATQTASQTIVSTNTSDNTVPIGRLFTSEISSHKGNLYDPDSTNKIDETCDEDHWHRNGKDNLSIVSKHSSQGHDIGIPPTHPSSRNKDSIQHQPIKTSQHMFIGMSLIEICASSDKLSNEGLHESIGLTVDALYVDGPAFNAGIQLGDIVVAVAGIRVPTFSLFRETLLKNSIIGEKIPFIVIRNRINKNENTSEYLLTNDETNSVTSSDILEFYISIMTSDPTFELLDHNLYFNPKTHNRIFRSQKSLSGNN